MDFYPDAGPAVSAAQLQLQAWHIASSPPGFLRIGHMPRLTSIPERPAEERRAAALPLQQHMLQHEPFAKVNISSAAPAGVSAACTDVLQLLEHPSVAVERQQLQQLAGESCGQPFAPEDATVSKISLQHSASSPFYNSGRLSSSSSGTSSEASSEAEADAAAAAAAVGQDTTAPTDLTAAASTWAMEIRHFTDCLPITPDSVCSSSTYLSLTGAQQHAQKQQPQQQQQPLQLQHGSRDAAGVRTCSLPHSSSSISLPQRCSSDGDAAAAATEAALQASFAALQELDDLEWCPWDRVATWLDSHAAAAGDQQLQQPESTSGAALRGSSSSLQLGSSSSLAAMSGQQQQQQHAEEEPVFDAPAWWQEAVLERLEQQRQAFHGSWWSKARVLASLAASHAACALQI
jgi:hypothetical protein